MATKNDPTYKARKVPAPRSDKEIDRDAWDLVSWRGYDREQRSAVARSISVEAQRRDPLDPFIGMRVFSLLVNAAATPLDYGWNWQRIRNLVGSPAAVAAT